MITIEIINDKDTFNDKLAIVQSIAQTTWPVTYGEILSNEQIDYMFDMMYSIDSLKLQAKNKNTHFILAKQENDYLGFASFEFNATENTETKIHKIYILPSAQGKGIGKTIIDYISKEASKQKNNELVLNVNKYNNAIHFYTKLGFSISEEVVIDIGNGYIMDDYIMKKNCN